LQQLFVAYLRISYVFLRQYRFVGLSISLGATFVPQFAGRYDCAAVEYRDVDCNAGNSLAPE
jgi:hypothetical protein